MTNLPKVQLMLLYDLKLKCLSSKLKAYLYPPGWKESFVHPLLEILIFLGTGNKRALLGSANAGKINPLARNFPR